MKLVNMKFVLLSVLSLFVIEAKALVLTPADCTSANCVTSDVVSQPSASDIQSYMGTSTILENLFKTDVGGGDTGAYADSYYTNFYDTANDPSVAVIGYESGDFIDCTECYVTVKDGNNSPSLYIFDISGWDGMELIELLDFWPAQGAISNVAIWGPGSSTTVPEPGTLALLGLGLIGMAFGRKKIS